MSYRVGLILKYLDEDYQATIFKGAAEEAQKLGIEIICIQGDVFDGSPSSESNCSFVTSWSELELDGIIFLSGILLNNASYDVSQKLKKVFKNIPLVSIGTVLDDFPSVICESKDSIEKLLDHLIQHHNYRNFLYLGGPVYNEDNNSRQKIISDYISLQNKKSKNQFSLEIQNGFLFSESDGLRLIEEYCNENPVRKIDAILAGSDDMASGISKYLRSIAPDSYRNCPITGFDNIPLAQTQQLSLTTIDQPTEQMGAKAVDTIFDILLNKKTEKLIKVSARTIIRNSCGCSEFHKHFSDEESLNPLQREQFMRDVAYFGQEIACASDFEKIKNPLKELLTNVACKDFSLILFPEPVEYIFDKGFLTVQINNFTINETKNNDSSHKLQNTKDIFSEIFKTKADPKTPRCIYQLRVGERRLGFIVYSANLNAPINMSIAGMFLSHAINRIYEFNQETLKRRIAEEEVLKISDLERLRFSLDLHDDICQRLAAMTMICKKDSDKNTTMKTLFNMANETLLRTRQYAHESFPVELDFSDLTQALEDLCEELQTDDCRISFNKTGNIFSLTSEQKINLFRISQEAIQNSIKHADAKNISVKLIYSDIELNLIITDDGEGFNSTEISQKTNTQKRRPKGLGLRSMQYRTNQIGGTFKIISQSGKGTSIQVTIPQNIEQNIFINTIKQDKK
ncbi:MAG: substrate-binding domain-containing protein [Treponema sp.]|nr:substrate-binding domain-containing protein [Candidatus Treponema merdequi]